MKTTSYSNSSESSLTTQIKADKSTVITWLVVSGLLLLLCGWSSHSLIEQQWSLPWRKLLTPSQQLDIVDMAIQLKLLATSSVALTAGGLLGVVSILLQQLVKNPLASDTTLGVGVGAQLAILLVTLFVPSLAIHGGFLWRLSELC